MKGIYKAGIGLALVYSLSGCGMKVMKYSPHQYEKKIGPVYSTLKVKVPSEAKFGLKVFPKKADKDLDGVVGGKELKEYTVGLAKRAWNAVK